MTSTSSKSQAIRVYRGNNCPLALVNPQPVGRVCELKY